MKKLRIIPILLLIVFISFFQIETVFAGTLVYVTSDKNANNAGTNQASVAKAVAGVTAGNLVVVWCKHEGAATTVSVSDGTSTFTAAGMTDHSNNDLHGGFFYKTAVVASGTVTYTCSFLASRPYPSIIVFVYSYSGTAALDVESHGTADRGSSADPTSANVTTTGTDEVVLGGYGEYASTVKTNAKIATVAATHTVVTDPTNYSAMWDKIETATFTNGNATVHLDASSDWICNIVSFKVTASATASAPANKFVMNGGSVIFNGKNSFVLQ